jgi:hypothetical protein
MEPRQGHTEVAMKAYTVKGTTDEVTTCELCGRDELKGTVVLVSLDADGNPDGEPSYFGTSCAAKAAGWTTREVTRRVTVAKKEAKAAAGAAARVAGMKARQEETAAYTRWLKETYPTGSPVKEYGVAALWAQFRASQAAGTEPVEEVKVSATVVEASYTPCPVLAEPGNIHLFHARCVECNAFRMAKMTPDEVEGWYHYGNISQAEFEAYMYAWSTSAVRYTAGGWGAEPTNTEVIKIVDAIRRHANLPSPPVLAA